MHRNLGRLLGLYHNNNDNNNNNNNNNNNDRLVGLVVSMSDY